MQYKVILYIRKQPHQRIRGVYKPLSFRKNKHHRDGVVVKI